MPATMASGAHSRKPSASSLSDARVLSPEASRIPRPSSRASPQTRRPFTVEEATDWAKLRLAQGSPSPAPRTTRPESVGSDYKSLPNMFSQRPIDLGRLGSRRPVNSTRREGTLSSKDSFGSSSRKEDDSDSEIDRKLKQFEEDAKIIKSMKEDKKGLFIKPKFGVTGVGPRATPTRRTRSGSFGNGSADGKESRQSWGFAETGRANPNWIRRFRSEEEALGFAPGREARIEGYSSFGKGVPGLKRKSPYQSLLGPEESPPVIPRPATVAPVQSPNKSYAWQIDDDFTAGDLQVSNSPPVSFGRANLKLDEIRKLEIDAELKYPIENARFLPQRTNTKIDEILQREKEMERKYPIPTIEKTSADPVGEPPTSAEDRPSFSSSKPARSDGGPHISQRTEDFTKKHPAPTPLEETTEQQFACSPPPQAPCDEDLGRSHKTSPHTSPEFKSRPHRYDYNGLDGERLPDTPVTIYRNASPIRPTNGENDANPINLSSTADHDDNGTSYVKEDSYDLLRKLARASSKSPSPSPGQEKTVKKVQAEDTVALPSPGEKDKAVESSRVLPLSSSTAKPVTLVKPTVGFAGISRSSSTKSVSSTQSRGSADPTARIEGEMKLFALMDNMSERGSVRAPSPRQEIHSESGNEGGGADKTPRPLKADPVSMPTPQVTGAFVETPMPPKIEQTDIRQDSMRSQPEPEKKAEVQIRDKSTSPRASNSDGKLVNVRSNSVSKLRRPRSTPRRRSPLKNSVKPPTVEEDLKQIHLSNNIDDSTLDDFAELIASSNNSEELDYIPSNGVADSEDSDNLPFDKQVERLNHFSKALNTGLAGIRQAKKGIERLEDRVAQSEQVPGNIKNETNTSILSHLPVPMPRLFRTQPKFKLTRAGTFVCVLLCWYFMEIMSYERWGRQYVCYQDSPCNWSPEQPDYGYVLPVKLDEWLTGGMIRPHAAHWLDEASDLFADFEDWWTGTDIRNVDFRSISDSARREQHFRRIGKKGLRQEWKPNPAYMPVIEALEREILAEEEAESRGDSYYGSPQSSVDESMAKDDVLSKASTEQEPPRIIWF